MFIKKCGKFIGLFSAIAVLFSIFLSFQNIGYMGYSVFSMSLVDFNIRGAIAIAVLAFLAFICVYAEKGILTGILSIFILVGMVFFCTNINTGSSAFDQKYQILNTYVGEFFNPGIGFFVALIGAILLFLSGIMINKGNNKEDSKEKDKDKR